MCVVLETESCESFFNLCRGYFPIWSLKRNYAGCCNFFYCDDPAKAEELFAMGIDTILTNDYLAIANVLKRIKEKE